jgi:hypothetical protein
MVRETAFLLREPSEGEHEVSCETRGGRSGRDVDDELHAVRSFRDDHTNHNHTNHNPVTTGEPT